VTAAVRVYLKVLVVAAFPLIFVFLLSPHVFLSFITLPSVLASQWLIITALSL
jgi:hypothetical protein